MMFVDKHAMSRTAAILVLCASALVLTGCSSVSKLNPFAEKDKTLPGERRPVFPPGSEFAGPRKLPPPNSDYVGATMPANQTVTNTPAPAPAPGTESAPAAGVPAHQAATKKQQPLVPEAPPLPPNAR
jgi:hypothetical protein